MKPRSILILLLVLAVAGVCVRLGFWQVARWREKRAMNVAMAAALRAPAIDLAFHFDHLAHLHGRRVRAQGRYDEAHQILLQARSHQGSPGVEVVTPLLFEGESTAVLVDRGWLYAADAATADPLECPEPGTRSVVGIVDSVRAGAGGRPIRELPRLLPELSGRSAAAVATPDSSTLYSARWLDRDSLQQRLPYVLLPIVIRQLPGPDVPDRPARRVPAPLNEMTHISYAIQWFLFAVIALVGSLALARSRSRRSIAPPFPGPRE